MTLRTRISQFIAFFFRSLLWSLNLSLVLYTALAYWLLRGLPTEHWLGGMIMITIPVAWVLNGVLMVVWLFVRPWRSWLSGIALIIGFILFGPRTFTWHRPVEPTNSGTALKLFSYNVEQFGVQHSWEQRYSSPRVRRMISYILHQDAPVKCFQELYSSTAVPDYNVVQKLRQAGYRYSVLLHPDEVNQPYGTIGAAIFSIYPIIESGRQPFTSSHNGVNGLVWATIKVGADTIRVINVHLHSMGIRVGRVLRQDELKGVKHETHGVLSALRAGFISRRNEVWQVIRHVRESRYPVIITGDHNDTPYSVVYERLRRALPNSFEDRGRGFGFTYNRLPGFIRIDHQFHDPRLTMLDFQTINHIPYSDHYPIQGTYLVK